MIETLKLLGLKGRAADIYAAALMLGTSSVQDIARKANLKRPTVYTYLEEMIEDGFVQKMPLGKKEYYRAVSPRELEMRLEYNLKTLQKEMPELELIHAHAEGRPAV
ncbi:MAG: helix-turn-helix domain-containing protein, partial [Acidobacteriota bacterium]